MPWSNTVTDVGSMGDRKYAYGTAHHSGHLVGTMTIPLGRVDAIYFTQVQMVTGATCENVQVSGAAPPWGTPATTWQTVLPIVQCASGAVALGTTYIWWAFGKRG